MMHIARARGRPARGFTLVELLVTIALLIIILALLALPMWSGSVYMERANARADAQSAGRRAMEAMTRELSEAMYVFDIPPESSMIAFVLPSRGSERVSPPGPQLSRSVTEEAFLAAWRLLPADRQTQVAAAEGRAVAIRYWPVLTRFSQDGAWEASEVIARTDVPLGTEYVPADGSRIPLAMDPQYPDAGYDPSYTLGDRETPTRLPVAPKPMSPDAAQFITSLTPNELGYEVPVLSFSPELMENETLRPVMVGGAPEYGVYRGQRSLWQRFTTHSAAGDPFANLGEVMIYRRPAPDKPYELKYHTVVDPTTRRLTLVERVLQQPPVDGPPVYFPDSYPVRDPASQPYALGIDYDRGQVLFSFPQPAYPFPERVQFRPGVDASTAQVIVQAVDHDGDGVADDANARIIPGSETVRLGGEILKRVPSTSQPARGQYSIDYDTGTITINSGQAGLLGYVTYIWRNNPDDDIVMASYQSKGLITVTLTVGKRTGRSGILEGFHLSTKVELGNARG